MPQIKQSEIVTFQDFAYAVHDQSEYIRKAFDDLKIMQESHFMTKRNKQLMLETKELKK